MDFHKPGPNKRVFAFLFDSLIANGITMLLSFVGVKIDWIVWGAYIIFKDCFGGQSIGKFCASLQIVNKDDYPVNFMQTIIRNIFIAIPIFPIIEYFVMVNDEQGRRIGDKVADTKVNDLRPGEQESTYLLLSIILFIIFGFIAWKSRGYPIFQT